MKSADATVPERENRHPAGVFYRWGNGFLLVFGSLLLAGLTFCLSTRNNDFPVQYHPDEWGKIAQIRGDTADWNFNHPLLMLHAARLYCEWFDVPAQSRDLSLAGRTTSAIFTASTVFALLMASWIRGGWLAWGLAVSAVAVCPWLIVHGHYFKEDSALVMGLAIAVLGATMHCSWNRWWGRVTAALVLGLGCALAASGKYVGLAVFVPAAITLLLSPLRQWWLTIICLILFAGTAVSLGVWINSEAFEDPWTLKLREEIRAHINDQYEHATASEWTHGQVVLKTPGTFCIRIASRNITPLLWAIAGASLAAWVFKPFCSRWMISMSCFILTFAVVLACNAIPIPRYALPLTVLFAFVIAGAAGTTMIRRVKQPRMRFAVAGLMIAAVFGLNLRDCLKLNHQFADDSRQRLREWIATSLPPSVTVVGERYTGLDSMGDPWRFPDAPRIRQTVIPRNFASDYRTIDNFRRSRAHYLVIAEPAYGRFLYPESTAGTGQETRFRATQGFYRALLAMKPVWQSDPDPPSDSYVNPTIRVYEINPPGNQKHPVP